MRAFSVRLLMKISVVKIHGHHAAISNEPFQVTIRVAFVKMIPSVTRSKDLKSTYLSGITVHRIL